MKNFTLDETDYTSSLKSAIDAYVRSQNMEVPESNTPHSSRQSVRKIDNSHCFDLIKRISEASILVLEVKITHDGKSFPSFNSTQRKVDAALNEVGIPIKYCYNLAEDYSEINQPIYTLENSNTALPETISDDSGNIINHAAHKRLRKLIDELINRADPIGSNVAVIFAKGVLKRIRDLNIKVLFFCCWQEDFESFTVSELYALYEEYDKAVNLGNGIDFESSSKQQIVSHLEDAKKHWLNREIKKDEPDIKTRKSSFER